MKKTVSLCLIGEKDAQNGTKNGGRWCGCVKEEERMVRLVCVCFAHGCVLGERTSDKRKERKACDVSIFVWNTI
jgi:hypothetical protein